MLWTTLSALAAAMLVAGALYLLGRRAGAAAVDRARSAARAEVDRARGEAEASRREILATARERADALRRDLGEEVVAAERAAADAEAALTTREASLAVRTESVAARHVELDAQFGEADARRQTNEARHAELAALLAQTEGGVEQRAGTTRQSTLERLRDDLIDGARLGTQKLLRLKEDHVRAAAETEAKRLIDVAAQRCGLPLPTERLVTTAALPKAGKLRDRLLADDAGLLKALGAATEVTFTPTESDPETLHLTASDPFTREVGRLAYERLIKDGNPSEALVAKAVTRAKGDLDRVVRAAGQRAVEVLGIGPMHNDIKFLVGKLLYRTSYTQNQWAHAIESSFLCGMMAEELGTDVKLARRAALIHDIGKVLYAETEAVGSHAVSGAAFAKDHGEAPEVVHPIAAHHDDEKPSTVLAHLVAAADALSGARPGARRDTDEAFSTRVEDLERICRDFSGIDRSYVIQGGRELRILVDQVRMDDLAAARLSSEVARRIEDECTYPGQIKVTVIRETRSTAVAR